MTKHSESQEDSERPVVRPVDVLSQSAEVHEAKLADASDIKAFLSTNQNLHDGSAGGEGQESIQIVALDENGKERILAERKKMIQNNSPDTMDTSTLLAIEAKTNPVAKVIALFRNWIEKLPTGKQKEEYRQLSRQQAAELSPEMKMKLALNGELRKLQVFGAGLLASIEKYQKDEREKHWGQLIGTVEGAGEVAVNLAKIADFSAALIKGDKITAEKMAAEYGTSLGQTIVSGIRLFQAADQYLYNVGFTGDYSKPFEDIAAVATILNENWNKLPPREQERIKAKLITEFTADGLLGLAGANAIKKASNFTEILDTLAHEAKDLANKTKKVSKRAIKSVSESVEELLTPAGDTGLGIKMKIPKDHADSIKNDTKMLMTAQGEFHMGRLRRTDFGEPRRTYNWPVINEAFIESAVRQKEKLSCVHALGEMLTLGEFREIELISKMEVPSDFFELAKVLGYPWKARSQTNFSTLVDSGPWGANLLEKAWTDLPKTQHVVLVDGLSPLGNVLIRDSWEGTRYEMKFEEFDKIWTGTAIFRQDRIRGKL